MDGVERHLRDVMNPPGMFLAGKRQREYATTGDPLPSSGKLIPEFFGRRNIRDMFARKPSFQQSQSRDISFKDAEVSSVTTASQESSNPEIFTPSNRPPEESCDSAVTIPSESPPSVARKRSAPATTSSKTNKRGKSGSVITMPPLNSKGQQSLKGFFKPSITLDSNVISPIQGRDWSQMSLNHDAVGQASRPAADMVENRPAPDVPIEADSLDSATHTARKVVRHTGQSSSPRSPPNRNHEASIQHQESVHDPVEIKESWSRLFTKPTAPRCEGHDEPCVSLLTKKPGMNLGRSFWMCPRPLGPSGAKEKNTQWRCQTFIWCSDWNSNVAKV